MHGEPTPFVLMFTIGNIIIIAGAFFYNGPYTQVLYKLRFNCTNCTNSTTTYYS